MRKTPQAKNRSWPSSPLRSVSRRSSCQQRGNTSCASSIRRAASCSAVSYPSAARPSWFSRSARRSGGSISCTRETVAAQRVWPAIVSRPSCSTYSTAASISSSQPSCCASSARKTPVSIARPSSSSSSSRSSPISGLTRCLRGRRPVRARASGSSSGIPPRCGWRSSSWAACRSPRSSCCD